MMLAMSLISLLILVLTDPKLFMLYFVTFILVGVGTVEVTVGLKLFSLSGLVGGGASFVL